jgi:hypothetical protein
MLPACHILCKAENLTAFTSAANTWLCMFIAVAIVGRGSPLHKSETEETGASIRPDDIRGHEQAGL